MDYRASSIKDSYQCRILMFVHVDYVTTKLFSFRTVKMTLQDHRVNDHLQIPQLAFQILC